MKKELTTKSITKHIASTAKVILFAVLIFETIDPVRAQIISPTVIAFSGEHFIGGSAQLSWTLGEPIVETSLCSNNYLTQGFHQTLLSAVPVESFKTQSSIKAYPNPTAEKLTLEYKDCSDCQTAELIDLTGKSIMRFRLGPSGHEEINLSSLATGLYILRISGEGDQDTMVFKIQKSSQ